MSHNIVPVHKGNVTCSGFSNIVYKTNFENFLYISFFSNSNQPSDYCCAKNVFGNILNFPSQNLLPCPRYIAQRSNLKQKINVFFHILFLNSSADTSISCKILRRSPVPISLRPCNGTEVVSLSVWFKKKWWLPFILTHSNPSFSKNLKSFFGEIGERC